MLQATWPPRSSCSSSTLRLDHPTWLLEHPGHIFHALASCTGIHISSTKEEHFMIPIYSRLSIGCIAALDYQTDAEPIPGVRYLWLWINSFALTPQRRKPFPLLVFPLQFHVDKSMELRAQLGSFTQLGSFLQSTSQYLKPTNPSVISEPCIFPHRRHSCTPVKRGSSLPVEWIVPKGIESYLFIPLIPVPFQGARVHRDQDDSRKDVGSSRPAPISAPCGSFPRVYCLFFPTGFLAVHRGFDAPTWSDSVPLVKYYSFWRVTVKLWTLPPLSLKSSLMENPHDILARILELI